MTVSRRYKTAALAAAVVLAAGITATAVTAPVSAATCTATLGQVCGPYAYAGIPMSNGYDTYVSDQSVNVQPGTTQTVTATDPGSWSVAASDVSCGGCVQTFPDVQQLTNDWTGSGWGGSGSSDTPMSALSSLAVSYSESSPQDAGSVYEFAPDVWTGNYPGDVMFWADTHGRCNTGAYGGTVLGTAVLDGQTWTVNRYGGTGAEIIFVLDSDPAVPDSCASQASGTIDILAGFGWLAANRIIAGLGTMSQLNTGWEISQSDNQVFTVSGYSITATAGPVPSPTPTSSPTPTPTTSPTPTPAPSPSPTPSPTLTGVTVYACLTSAGKLTQVSVTAAPVCASGSSPVRWQGQVP